MSVGTNCIFDAMVASIAWTPSQEPGGDAAPIG